MLLTDDEMSLALSNQGYTDEVHAELQVVAKAQLKRVVEGIEDTLVKYSVVEGKLSKYIEGTVPLWALPNEIWQSLLDEVK